MAEPLNVDWVAIREAAIAGVPFKVLASQFGIIGKDGKPNTGAIRIRALRENWPVVTRLVSQAKREAKEASRKLEEARKIRAQYLNSSQANSPSVTIEPIERETRHEDLEPGLADLGFMGDSPLNQGSRVAESIESGVNHGADKQDSRVLPMNQSFKGAGFGDGNKGSLSIGEVGNASSSLQSSESTAATLIQAHMAQLAQESIIQALQRAHASIHAAPSQLPIATITDLRSAAKLAMELTGMDKQGNTTNLAILVSPTPKQGTWNFHDSPESLTIDAE